MVEDTEWVMCASTRDRSVASGYSVRQYNLNGSIYGPCFPTTRGEILNSQNFIALIFTVRDHYWEKLKNETCHNMNDESRVLSEFVNENKLKALDQKRIKFD